MGLSYEDQVKLGKVIAKEVLQAFKTDLDTTKKTLEADIKKKEHKYPSQVASIKRSKKVLGVDAKLFTPTDKENAAPLELHSGFSRFELTIVDKESNTTPTANIPAEDIYYIVETSRIALEHLLTNKQTSNSTQASGTAYTQKLIDKNFKGKTPAEVLLADPSQETNLLNAKKFLEANLSRFPANKSQIVAIDEAVKLLHENKLSVEGATANASHDIEIYKTDYKFKSKKNEKGYNLIYGIDVVCDPNKNYPFAITIMNCYAPVETGPNGQKTIKMNVAENTIKSTLLVTKDEWIKLISKLDRVLTMFEHSQFEALLNESRVASQY
jgi:hypothetical protein